MFSEREMKEYVDREFNEGKEFTETTTTARYEYRGKIIDLRNDDIALPNGKPAKREFVEHRGGVAVLAVDDRGYLPLVRQFRYPLRSEIWEIPAGKLEAGEDPDEAIRRELTEETGLVAEKFERFAEFYPTVGYSNEIIRIYLATGLTYVGAHPDEDEFLELKYIHVDELYKMCLDGSIKDGKTVLGVLKYHALKEGK